ncbi:MAG: DNA translocase FtsK 4TM domain-containing protein, partial [Paracoccaceae bacterium]
MTMIWDDDGAPAREHPAMALIAAAASRLVGLAALALGLALAAAIASYDANDPSYFTATGRAATNWLGGPGALIADFAMHGIGLAGWVVVALVLVWGWRLALARGDERFWSRLPAMPLAVAAVAVLASLAAPGPGWPVGGGLGGLLGDRAASVLVHSFEMAPETARGRLLPGVGVLALILTLLALGLSRGELRAAWARLRRLPDEPEPAPSPRAQRPAARAEDAPSRPGRVGRLARGALAGAVPALRRAGASVVRFGATRGGGLAGLAPSRSPAAAPAGPARGIEPVLRSIAGDDAPTAPRPRPAPPRTEAPSRDPAPADLSVETDEDEADDDEIDLTPPAAEDGPVVKPRKPLTLGRGARSGGSAQPVLFAAADDAPYDAPPLDLLARSDGGAEPAESEAALAENARALETVLDDYGVRGEIAAVKPGPVVTLYELEPAPGLKAQRVIGLADDIARSMSALSARIATVPGRSVIGIELPNEARETVWLRDVFEGRAYAEARFPLALALGRDIEGEPVIANLAKMPHLLIAGTTGSGKSVAINTMILSLLYRLSPRQCRLIMIDPKMLELSVYDDIPHLLAPVVTDPKKAVVALKWVVAEMEE